MRWVPVLLACGCNNVFGLTPTDLVDAPPPIDAPDPPRCPAIGDIPQFGDDLRSIPAVGCLGYATSDSGTAIAYCNNQVARGPVDGEMTTITLDEPLYEPRMAPDADELFALRYDPTTYRYQFVDLQWRDNKLEQIGLYDPPTMYTVYYSFSTPTRGPDRHLIYLDYNYTTNLYELVEAVISAGAWTEVDRYPVSDLGLAAGSTPLQLALSPDGLRLVFMTPGVWTQDSSGQWLYSDPVYYADRAAMTNRFNLPVALPSVPDQVQWPFLSADCGRIYFSALNRVFYLVQPPR